MVIPKGLIIYRAPRHGENRPLSLKYKKHSDTSSLSASSKKPHRTNPKRFAQKVTLQIDTLKASLVTRSFKNVHQARKCMVSFPERFAGSSEESKRLIIKIIQKFFQTLKGLRHVKLENFGPLQKHPKTFKGLLRQKNLTSLTLTSFYYTKKSPDFQPFMRVLKAASRRWPHLESLRVDDFEAGDDSVSGLENLRRFLSKINKYDVVKKCFSFNVTFSDTTRKEKPETIEQILEFINLNTSYSRHTLQDKLLAFEKLNSSICQIKDQNSSFYTNLFAQIQRMAGLQSLTLDFSEGVFDPHLLHIFPKLTELTDLELRFNDSKDSRPQIKSLLEKIGEKKKLKTLCLEFTESREDKEEIPLFQRLCKYIGKLKQITKLQLKTDSKNSMRNEGLKWLAVCLQSIPQLETLFIHIDNSEFQPKEFEFFMDCIIKDSPKLSDLSLFLSSLNLTKRCFQWINKAINEMKGLNQMRIDILGLHEKFSHDLNAEVQKKMKGELFFGNIK